MSCVDKHLFFSLLFSSHSLPLLSRSESTSQFTSLALNKPSSSSSSSLSSPLPLFLPSPVYTPRAALACVAFSSPCFSPPPCTPLGEPLRASRAGLRCLVLSLSPSVPLLCSLYSFPSLGPGEETKEGDGKGASRRGRAKLCTGRGKRQDKTEPTPAQGAGRRKQEEGGETGERSEGLIDVGRERICRPNRQARNHA